MLTVLNHSESQHEEVDRFAAAPHPREMLSLIGHETAERELLDSFRAGRLHHAWLIGGEEGIGKATLAYRMARFVLAHPDPGSMEVMLATDLSVPADHPVAAQIAAGAHPDLAVIRRAWDSQRKAVPTEIRVDDVRKGLDIFTKTAGSGGYRVAIVDACDDLNASGANALLKTLEEPPARSLWLLIAHQPRRLLPTIRSRCRSLSLRPLEAETVARITRGLPDFAEREPNLHMRAAALAEGSVRNALTLLDPKSLAFHDSLDSLMDNLPALDADAVDRLAEQMAGRAGEASFRQFCDRVRHWLSGELHRRAPEPQALQPLAEVWERLNRQQIEAEVYNLDRRPMVIGVMQGLSSLFPLRS
ncbi:MAG TPA: DNA polymerase III subunit delta' [Beijerinckiaceae bacterium]|nr:DNA polymerase III subunit delta' [Beijerinckiaceae bacterium]